VRRLLLNGWLVTEADRSIRCSGVGREEVGVAVEVQGPSGVVGDTIADTFPAGSVPFDVAVLEV
jgi:hypothetical protein